ncbi:MAG TPA: MOSC N-terminal beta barrel domain-containing protein [Candidatus Dormibacteraeota bacterium]
MTAAGIVSEIWRYPVKSMQGERLERATFSELGLEGDRRWALRDVRSGKLVSAKQNRNVLFGSARLEGEDVVMDLPDGGANASDWLGREVTLERADGRDAGVYEMYLDPTDETSPLLEITTPAGTFLDAAPVHLMSRSSAGSWDPRRFRPNLLIDTAESGFPEDGWVGSAVRIGQVVLTIVMPTLRCGIPGRAQPGFESDLDVVRTLKAERQTLLGVYALVDRPGEISVGDAVEPA